jgi:AraC-like DNA-binding protein
MSAAELDQVMPCGEDATSSFARAVDAWLQACASPELADLAAATGLSRRQLERRCNQLYGVPPKLLARRHRALQAAALIAQDRDAPDGFYDQSHMIRELKRFVGLTPRQIRERATPTCENDSQALPDG